MVISMGLRIVIAGGGTGGHLYPGIAVAQEMTRRSPKTSVTFAGTMQGIESRAVPEAGFELDFIRSAGLKGKSGRELARNLAMLPVSACDAWRLLSRRVPHLVMGVGGYSSGPVVAIAALRGIPTLVLEQNVIPGLTNRLLAPFVRAVAVAFASTLSDFGSKGFMSGNPVRKEFFEMGSQIDQDADSETCHVLVIGGSQGAHALNLALRQAAPALAQIKPRLIVTHQTGERDLVEVRESYRQAGLNAQVETFLEPMAKAMLASDLVICRAGATTVTELAAVGRPSVLVPLRTADEHQSKNADALVTVGAAKMIAGGDVAAALVAHVKTLAANRKQRSEMGAAARQLARPDAAARIVDRVLELVHS